LTLSIREAVPEEYDEVAKLMVAAYEEFAPTLGEEWDEYRDDLADVARRAAQGTQFVAEMGGHLVGTVTYYPPLGDAAAADEWWWWPKDFAYVRALGVHPEARGGGVGRDLTIACIERAKADGAHGVALNTVSLMHAATALYEGLGFRQTGGEVTWGVHPLLSYVLNINRSG
jgi:ribosomal protein S18 acetylase RimI-like enzyme